MMDCCLNCQLPECDEDSPRCGYRAALAKKRRPGNAERRRRYRQQRPMACALARIEHDSWRRVLAAEQAVRRALEAGV